MQTEKLLKTNQDVEEFLFWIATLQSGVVRKAKEQLNSKKGGYCCLGVAVACTIPDELIIKHENSNRLAGLGLEVQNNSPKWLSKIDDYCTKQFNVSLMDVNDGEHEIKIIDEDGDDSTKKEMWSHKKIADFLLDKFNQNLL